MGKPKVDELYDNDITRSVHAIEQEGSTLKSEIFKAMIVDRDINKTYPRIFVAKVNEFLEYWDSYMEQLADLIKHAKGEKGIMAMDYEFAKEYIYASYDYAAILPFADGVMKGVREGKFSETTEIDDFRDHTASRAFKNQPPTIGELLDSVLDETSMRDATASNLMGAKMFDSIRSYRGLYDRRNRAELYNSIKKVTEYITDDVPRVKAQIGNTTPKLYISMVNNIVGFMTYSLAVYACRIYVISKYAYPFIRGHVRSYGEATNPLSNVSYETSRVFADVNEAELGVPARIQDLMDTFDQFLGIVGADTNGDKPTYNDRYKIPRLKNYESNPFIQKLSTNELFEFITKSGYRVMMNANQDPSSTTNVGIQEINQFLKSTLYNPHQGNPTMHSPKQEILHVIRGTEPKDETLKGYQNLAYDLYLITLHLCGSLENISRDLSNWKDYEFRHPSFNTASANKAQEDLRMIGELYRDITSAVINKARHIELIIGRLRGESFAKLSSELSISVPGGLKSDICMNNNMMSSVPDTTRMPIEMTDLYALPTFESLQMYDEYLRTIPALRDCLYLNESINVSGIINEIISKIKGWWKRFNEFTSNKYFKAAVKWVTDHETDLTSMDFSGQSMTILDYKTSVGPPKGFENLQNGLKNFDAKIADSMESVEKWEKGLYPSEGVYSWFQGKGENLKGGATKYRNYVLFVDDETKASDQPTQGVKIEGAAIAEKMKIWIDTIKNSQTTADQFREISTELENGINSIKSKATTLENQKTETTTSDKPAEPPAGEEKAEGDKSTTSAPPAPEKKEEKVEEKGNTTNIGAATTAASKAVQNLWGSITPMLIDCMKNQYRYIKEAYSIGKKEASQ